MTDHLNVVSRTFPQRCSGQALGPVPVLAPAWVSIISFPLCLTLTPGKGEAAAANGLSDVQYQTANADVRQNGC